MDYIRQGQGRRIQAYHIQVPIRPYWGIGIGVSEALLVIGYKVGLIVENQLIGHTYYLCYSSIRTTQAPVSSHSGPNLASVAAASEASTRGPSFGPRARAQEFLRIFINILKYFNNIIKKFFIYSYKKTFLICNSKYYFFINFFVVILQQQKDKILLLSFFDIIGIIGNMQTT